MCQEAQSECCHAAAAAAAAALLLLACCCCVASAVAEAGLGGERDDAAFSATRTKKRRPPSASTCHRLASTDPAAACHRRPLPPRARLRCPVRATGGASRHAAQVQRSALPARRAPPGWRACV